MFFTITFAWFVRAVAHFNSFRNGAKISTIQIKARYDDFQPVGEAAETRVSSKWKKKKIRFEPKQTETRSVSRLFRFVSWNQKKNFSVSFGVSNLYRNNRNKQNCFEMNRNNPEFSEKSILGSSVCHIPVIFLSSCRPVIVAERWTILDVSVIKLTKETRGRVSRGREQKRSKLRIYSNNSCYTKLGPFVKSLEGLEMERQEMGRLKREGVNRLIIV